MIVDPVSVAAPASVKVFHSRAVHRDFQDLPKDVRSQAERQLALLIENPRRPSLRVKKIRGVREPRWEGRISRGYRFTFDWDGDTIILRRIGTHEIIDREAETIA